MDIYAIGDLHLTEDENKSMEKFGWIGHEKAIFDDWGSRVKDDDIVLIAGDISWAMRIEEAKKDLDKIHSMKGKKILVKGNHDYWWASIKKLNTMYDDMFFIQNNIFELEDYVICGSRLWISPNDISFTKEDEKIYLRERIRLENSLKLGKNTGKKIILLVHYPPKSEDTSGNGFVDLIDSYNVTNVLYGHLHGKHAHAKAILGQINNTTYDLVSCDFIDFKLKKIISDI